MSTKKDRFEVQVDTGASRQTYKFKFDEKDKESFTRARSDALIAARAKVAEAINSGHQAVLKGPGSPRAVSRSIDGVEGAPDSAFKL